MRGFLIAIVLGCLLITGVFSLRPGGLRVQLRLMKRRFRVAFTLAGIFLVVSFVIRVAAPTVLISDIGMAALGLATAVAFLIWAQDPPLETTRPPDSRPPR
jgi:hypothetical protein